MVSERLRDLYVKDGERWQSRAHLVQLPIAPQRAAVEEENGRLVITACCHFSDGRVDGIGDRHYSGRTINLEDASPIFGRRSEDKSFVNSGMSCMTSFSSG